MELLLILAVIYAAVRASEIKKTGSSRLPGFQELFNSVKKTVRSETWGGGGAGSSEELSSRSAAASGMRATRNGSGKAEKDHVTDLPDPEPRNYASSLSSCSGMNIEDREHDWLAGQLREEQRSYRAVSEMFEIKLSHMHSCDAENLRLSHSRSCDAEKLRRDSRL